MIKKLLRSLGVRREVQRRLDVNLEFDDLDDDAGAVRNGARLALVSLRSWLDGFDGQWLEDGKDSRWMDDAEHEATGSSETDLYLEIETGYPTTESDDLDGQALAASEAYANQVPHVTDACVGERCWFWWEYDGKPLVRSEGILAIATTYGGSFGTEGFKKGYIYSVMVDGNLVMIGDPSK